jgi:hypothetical protein
MHRRQLQTVKRNGRSGILSGFVHNNALAGLPGAFTGHSGSTPSPQGPVKGQQKTDPWGLQPILLTCNLAKLTTWCLQLKQSFNQPPTTNMSYNTPRITKYEHNPVFGTPPLHFTSPQEREAERTERERNVAAASREQGERELAFVAALNREAAGPRPIQPPGLRAPKLSFDAAALEETIYRRGVAF